LLLLVFRLGAVLPIPGINAQELKNYVSQQQSGNPIVDYLDFFAGGAFSNFSVFMLGIMPYISMSIIMQLLIIVFPTLKKISQEEGGRKKIQAYQRLGTVAVCIIQSFAVTRYAQGISREVEDLISIGNMTGTFADQMPFTLIAILTVTTGTMFLMWLGEQITKRGIGNGISLLIFGGIVARLPMAIWELIEEIQRGLNPVFVAIVFVMFIAVISLVVFEQQGQRKISVHYAKRVVGRRMYGAQNTYIPFKINPSGVIPVIFASSILTFPIQIASTIGQNVPWLAAVSSAMNPRGILYNVLYVLLIIFFAYFYTQVTLNPIEIAKNIRENGGSIPGIRTERIEEYLTKILNRIVLPGSLYLAVIAVLPTIIQILFKFPSSISYLMGGTSLLILVGVDLDTMSQVEGLLKMHHHEGLTKRGRLKGRNL
jgi:preprotein translocase subunit SecY